MTLTYIHTCCRILDPERSEDFYVGKLGVVLGAVVGVVLVLIWANRSL